MGLWPSYRGFGVGLTTQPCKTKNCSETSKKASDTTGPRKTTRNEKGRSQDLHLERKNAPSARGNERVGRRPRKIQSGHNSGPGDAMDRRWDPEKEKL